MPAIITHHLFGEDAAALLPQGILDGQEDLLAFLLGNQGTDPFWARFSTTPAMASTCHAFALRVHAEHISQALMALRDCVSRLPEEDKSIGRAFALGMAGHYVFDSVAHPLVYAQQEDLIAVDPSLENARSEIHSIMEADLDVWMLREKRNATVLDTPCTQALARTERIDRIAGTMLSQVAWQVFGLEVGATEYGLAVRDYALFYRLIDPPSKIAGSLARLERIGRPHSYLLAHAHHVTQDESCPFANLKHHLWRNPATNEASRASFPDLFHDALMAWPAFSQRLAEGNLERLEAMVAGIDYNGRPTQVA